MVTLDRPVTICIDDERDIRELIQRVLGSAGFQVITAANGQQGVDLSERQRPDLVLLDVKMPGKSGLDVLRELKARDIDAAVVMVSGMGDTPTAVACMTSGATDYIVKPFTTEELLRRVNGALEKRILVRQNRDYQKTLEQRVGEQTSHLEQKVRELTALNGLFQAYLAQRDETEVAFDELADQILMIAEEVRAHARKIESRRAEIRALMQGKTAS